MIDDQRKAYASAFSAFLVGKSATSGELKQIKQIILFGSIARADAEPESDVDIFINVEKEHKKFRADVEKSVKEFYASKDALLFKTFGVENKINVIIGKLKDWKDLHRSVMSTGIVLWGPFIARERPIGTKHRIIFHWSRIEKNRGAFLNKIYGYTLGKVQHTGLVDSINGQRLGKSCIIVPVEEKEEFIKLFKKYGVNVKALEVFID